MLEGATAATQSWQLPYEQLRQNDEYEAKAAQSRSNLEVREIAHNFEAIEQERLKGMADLQAALRQEAAAENIASQNSQRWYQEVQQM